MASKVVVTLIEAQQPCTACLITGNLIKEMLDRIKKDHSYLEIKEIKLENLKDVHSIEGLEVENFPALIVNGEQVTAGSLPMKRQLISLIEMEAENDESD